MTSTKQTTAPTPKSRASTTAARGYAAQSATTPLAPFSFERRGIGPRDVKMEILFCGVCHSDLHLARNEWGMTTYPIVPGHEIVGRVTEVGAEVKKFAAVGGTTTIVDYVTAYRGEDPMHALATWRRWAAWWTPVAPVPTARRGWSSSARSG